MEAKCRARQVADNHVLWCLGLACRLSKAEIHSEYVMFIFLPAKIVR